MLDLDYSLFNFINQSLANSVLDFIAPVFRERSTWIPLYLILFILMFYKLKLKSWLIIIGAIVVVGISDYSSSSIIKPIFKRDRPCRDPKLEGHVRSLVNCGAAYSFPSSHAANHFALAGFLSITFFRRFRSIKIILYFWAFLIAFSQVYVGVHFPLDVTAGALWGLLISVIIFTIMKRLKPELISLHL